MIFNIKKFRKSLGLTIREFSYIFLISSRKLHNIEKKTYREDKEYKRLKMMHDIPAALMFQLVERKACLTRDKRKMVFNKAIKMGGELNIIRQFKLLFLGVEPYFCLITGGFCHG